ncbi:beta-N-acetylhexosaminidase [Brachybacterium hainanense]|uniref:beta-N-acetylhexosaminidase n=1 Tax=Brachybacterium hainanense TaxID=1541174 RepID=A0ABV6RI40_9MICO
MTAPLALLPLPQHVSWSAGVWASTDPWRELSVGLSEDLPRTEYALSISPQGASLTAGSEAALADGRNTFAQIVAGTHGEIPCVSIHDAPRHAWRGLHLDVVGRFVDLAELEKIIDALALHRMNVLQLQLSDDQGWRVEIKGYPRLTEIGSVRSGPLRASEDEKPPSELAQEAPHGGFYTQQELRALVAYAHRRGVTIIPQISLPGHMQAAIAAYPQLGAVPDRRVGVREVLGGSDHVLGVSDEVFAFVRDVLVQVAEVFPAALLHIGAETCARGEWERSAEVRARMVDWGMTRVSEVQGRFTTFAADVLAEHGTAIVGGDDVLSSRTPDGTTIVVSSGERALAEAISRGFPCVVGTEALLGLDRPQGPHRREEPGSPGRPLRLRDVYEAPLVPPKLADAGRTLVRGIQASLPTGRVSSSEELERLLFPRLCAVAERAWGSPPERYEQFLARLRDHLPRLDAFGIAYRELD